MFGRCPVSAVALPHRRLLAVQRLLFDENLVKSGGRILVGSLRAEGNFDSAARVWLLDVLARNRRAAWRGHNLFRLTTSEMAALRSLLAGSR